MMIRPRPVIAVTGAGGQLGRELMRTRWDDGVQVCGYSSAELDICNPDAVAAVLETLQPSIVVNAAAYTAVDQAEDEPELAEAVNATAVKTLAQASNRVGAMLVQVSTDYVFDGSKSGWYNESDPIAPLGVYGRTKAAGEQAADEAAKLVVLRTSWVYGALGSNFVTTMLRLAGERNEIGVVADQLGCPTAAGALARAIVALARATDHGAEPPSRRLYHLAGPDALSRHGFADAVFACSQRGFDGTLRPLTTNEYPTKATRPANSRLDSSLIAHELGIVMPSFEMSVADVVIELESMAAKDRGGEENRPPG